MSLRAVLDPNVLVSAAISNGNPRALLRCCSQGMFELVVSAELLMELQEVLSRHKFRRYLTLGEVRAYVLWLHDLSEEVSEELPPEITIRGVTEDPKDEYLLGVAVRSRRSDVPGIIVSGDGHFLNLPGRRVADGAGNTLVRILTAREFLEELYRDS